MKNKIQNIKVPIHKETGDLIVYTGYWHNEEDVEWIDNHEFLDTMIITGTSRGRSSVKLELQNEQGLKYEMFVKGMEYMLKRAHIKEGKVSGLWHYVKRGANYGIAFSS